MTDATPISISRRPPRNLNVNIPGDWDISFLAQEVDLVAARGRQWIEESEAEGFRLMLDLSTDIEQLDREIQDHDREPNNPEASDVVTEKPNPPLENTPAPQRDILARSSVDDHSLAKALEQLDKGLNFTLDWEQFAVVDGQLAAQSTTNSAPPETPALETSFDERSIPQLSAARDIKRFDFTPQPTTIASQTYTSHRAPPIPSLPSKTTNQPFIATTSSQPPSSTNSESTESNKASSEIRTSAHKSTASTETQTDTIHASQPHQSMPSSTANEQSESKHVKDAEQLPLASTAVNSVPPPSTTQSPAKRSPPLPHFTGLAVSPVGVLSLSPPSTQRDAFPQLDTTQSKSLPSSLHSSVPATPPQHASTPPLLEVATSTAPPNISPPVHREHSVQSANTNTRCPSNAIKLGSTSKLGVPKCLQWGHCVVGAATIQRLLLVNKQDEEVHCILEVVPYDVDPNSLKPADSATIPPFSTAPLAILSPNASAHVAVTFSPPSVGSFRALLLVRDSRGQRPTMRSFSSSMSKHAPLAVVALEAEAEPPKWQLLPSNGETLDFGTLVPSRSHRQSIRLANHGNCSICLALTVTAPDDSPHVAQSWTLLTEAATSPHDDKVPSRTLSPLPVAGGVRVVIGANAHVDLWLQFRAVGYDVHQGMVEYRALLNVDTVKDFDVPQWDEIAPSASLSLVARVGYGRLQVPRDAQSLAFVSAVGVAVSKALPLRNSGCIPLSIDLSIAPHQPNTTGVFTVTPATIVLQPGDIHNVTVTFQPQAGALPAMTKLSSGPHYHSHLTLSVAPSLAVYRVALEGYIKSLTSLDDAMPVPPTSSTTTPLLLDKSALDWAGVDIGKKKAKLVRIQNNLEMSCTLKAYVWERVHGTGKSPFSVRPRGKVTGSPSNSVNTPVKKDESSPTKKGMSLIVVLSQKGKYELEVLFLPREMQMYTGHVILEVLETGAAYKLPLFGYGGRSNVVVDMATSENAKGQRPSSVHIDFGTVRELWPHTKCFSATNTGNRTGFARAIVRNIEGWDGRVQIEPQGMVIPPNQRAEFSITLVQRNGSNTRLTGPVSPRIRVHFVVGDEIARRARRARRQPLRADKGTDIFDEQFAGEQQPLNEDGASGCDTAYVDTATSEDAFQSSLQTIKLVLSGRVVPDAANNVLPQGDSAQLSDIRVSPAALTLSAAKPVAQLTIGNHSYSVERGFEVLCPPFRPISVEPACGVIPPRSHACVTVWLMKTGDVDSWQGKLVVLFDDGEQESVELGVEQAVQAPTNMAVAAPSVSTENDKGTVRAVKKHAYPRGLFVKDKLVVFSPTLIGNTQTKKLRVCNGSDADLKVWIESPDLPFVVKYPKIGVRAKAYVLLPIRFCPTSVGTFQRTLLLSAAAVGEGEVVSAPTEFCQVVIVGEAVSFPLVVGKRPLTFSSALDHTQRDVVKLLNVGDKEIRWTAAIAPATPNIWCNEKGVLAPHSEYDLIVSYRGGHKASRGFIGRIVISAESNSSKTAFEVGLIVHGNKNVPGDA